MWDVIQFGIEYYKICQYSKKIFEQYTNENMR